MCLDLHPTSMYGRTAYRLAVPLALAIVAMIGTGPFLLKEHRIATVIGLLLALGLALVSRSRLAYTNLGLLLAGGGIARMMDSSDWAGVIHELLGPVALAIACAVATLSSRSYEKGSLLLEDSGKPSLSTLTRITPVAIAVQILLGALFRNGVTGVMPHIAGAIIVGAIIMFAVISVLILPGVVKPLQWTAGSLFGVTFAQILLGIYAYMSKIATAEGNPTTLLSIITVAHIVTGALTIGLSVVLALFVTRYVRLDAESSTSSNVSVAS